ncbi:MAG TPA: wax ester/triacylglycerol synthase family O-acyltransferase [Acidimicrobiia bacterium]|nr:wax ester/triacylglycerol synthase family O-acyltransferase [Acidimicrobiia bacterium]
MPTHYERLSFLDSTFLAMEGRENPMHVGGTLVFEGAGLRLPDGGVDIERIRAFIEARLQYIPRYRQRLQWIPVERHPVWVDDEHFDLTYHVRHTALPAPGGMEQLRALAGRVYSQRMDRTRPLWEIWVVEGLQDDRVALVTKVHHCMIDGLSGVDLLKVTLSPIPDATIGEPDVFEPRPSPSPSQLFVDEAKRRVKMPLDATRSVAHFVESSKDVAEEVRYRINAMLHSMRSGWLSNASLTPINQTIGPNRRIDFLETDLDRVKAVKNALGGTVNDVVIAVVAGAVRSFLGEDRGVDVDELDFRVMVPVSTRDEDQSDELGNQVTMWLIDLPVAEPDPVKRLAAVRQSTAHLKETHQALGAAMLTQSASWTPGTLLSVAARVASVTIRPFNMTVTNVPGPQIPLYLMGARMVANYPMVPLWVNHGIGVALFSYDGKMHWGVNSDWDLVPDLHRFTERLTGALEELEAAAAPKPPRRRRTSTAKPPTKGKAAPKAKASAQRTGAAKTATAAKTTAVRKAATADAGKASTNGGSSRSA